MKSIFSFCRNCLLDLDGAKSVCPACAGARIARHEELNSLSIAHLDCDAFYAAVEKRDDPSLADRPVIVGGGVRGVVSTCCYIARTYGVRSAMPMFKALDVCPHAVVIKPNMAKYVEVGREVRRLMLALTPQVEPLSIDEAFMDLTGTERVHGAPAAKSLARLQVEIESKIGVTVSIGLSHNKFLAKIASDLEKPRGFSMIGKSESQAFLRDRPVSIIWGVGDALSQKLEREGIKTIADLQALDPSMLAKRFGELGFRLARLSRGIDARQVEPLRETKSVSAETTFDKDVSDAQWLEDRLWRLCEKAAHRMKEKNLSGRVITLKLKTASFRTISKRVTLSRPTNLAGAAFDAARLLLHAALDGRKWRLIGVGFSDLTAIDDAHQIELFDSAESKIAAREHAIDEIRARFGDDVITAGRLLRRDQI